MPFDPAPRCAARAGNIDPRYTCATELARYLFRNPETNLLGDHGHVQGPTDRLDAWQDACKASKTWLQTTTNESLQEICSNPLVERENWGTLMVRCIFHTWCHLGEISSIRQILGHKPPQFVNMHEWAYDGR